MPKIVTKSELLRISREMPLKEQASLRKSAKTTTIEGSTFLSHSSKDTEAVVAAIAILKNHGAKVYVDEVDPTLPPFTTQETAKKLKKRITQCARFVLLASEKSKNSRWVPWELGIADGKKGLARIATFPVGEDAGSDDWANWEYMGVYRKIVWGKLKEDTHSRWLVWNEDENTAIPLRKWITGN